LVSKASIPTKFRRVSDRKSSDGVQSLRLGRANSSTTPSNGGQRLTKCADATGTLIALNQVKRPAFYLGRPNRNDVARAEDLTFISSERNDDAGPTSNWMPPYEAYSKLGGWFEGSKRGRAMYLIPYVLGAIGSAFA
jgi:GTP-dependent phosphoenolpyruvate carboxykinase